EGRPGQNSFRGPAVAVVFWSLGGRTVGLRSKIYAIPSTFYFKGIVCVYGKKSYSDLLMHVE
ncbi:MAG: hypothetical protein KJN80_01200, partial [Deltaproteobacteria bacterium]|nr:hypothetical protein [Deltaproteobacteria bacterium]